MYFFITSDKPRATLTSGPTTIPVGGRVTLTCSVEPSAGWKYEWFTHSTYSSEDQENRVISVSQGGIYWCRGGRGERGEPVYYTDISDDVTIEITFSNKAVVTQQHNWPQIFRGEKINLTCEVQGGEDTEWKYEWRKPRSSTHWTNNKYWTFTASESSSGVYMCRSRLRDDSYSSTEWSEAITLSVSATKPKARLSAHTRDIPVGGSVNLTCSVTPSSGWKYYWYRDEKSSEPLTTQHAGFYSNGQMRVSQEGMYWCRGGRGDPVYYTEYSDSVRINGNVPNKVTVTLQPTWPQIYSGENITLRCEIHGGDTEWEYEWRSTSSYKPPNQNEFRIESDSSLHTGDYKCKGRMKSEQQSSTEWSDSFRLTVFISKQPVLSVSPSWLSPGASVTLSCEVEHPSAGWRFYWYKAVPVLSHKYQYSNYELLPGSINGTEQDSYIIDGQTHTAGYVCRAGRGEPVFYTDYSPPQFVWSGDFHSPASLTVNPDRVQHFTSDSVSLSCEGNSTEWRVRRFPEDQSWSCSGWRTMTGSTCKLSRSQSDNAVYWCESGSGEISNAVNITFHAGGIILVSPVHPVTEGKSVSLGCKLKTQNVLSTVFFYHNNKLIQNDTREELNISAVSKSDEGFYECEHSGKRSPKSWMAVKSAPGAQSSSFPVPLIAGLLCGVILIVLLLLLYRCRPRPKDSCFHRSTPVRQNETLNNTYPPQGDADLYDTIKHNTANDGEDVTYTFIKLKNIGKKRTHREPEDRVVYADVYTKGAGSSREPQDTVVYADVMKGRQGRRHKSENVVVYTDVEKKAEGLNMVYAQVNHHKKGRPKKTKGKSTPATPEAVSEESVMNGTKEKHSYRLICAFCSFICHLKRKESQKCQLDVRMGRTLLCELVLVLLYTLLCKGHTEGAVLTTDPYWSPLFTGESVTFICDMKEGGVTDWDYKIYKNGRGFIPYNTYQRYTLNGLSPGYSGGYQCCGYNKWSYQTKCSNIVTLTVSDKPKPTLTSGPTTIPVGGRVTLTCSVEPSAGWKYEWFTHSTYSSEDQENRVISVSQGGIYRCRGGRGEPVYYTYPSDPVTVEKIISNKAVVTRQHNWPQIFRDEKITLTCEVQGGEDTEWIYDWRTPRSSIHWTDNKYWTFTASESSSGDYMCRTRLRDDSYSSTEWTEAITLSVSDKQPVLSVSPSWLSPGASSQSTNQSSATDHMINQDEGQQSEHPSPLHGQT
ncbi:uncharacterized protein LOC125012889 [Mugil cephalus]|uniref:uncharacterized protein LOC125012889 n=1 Tax=Mugil cephalus TaxID=48193 RepID=UPI001FB7B52A|nr:uncharacterized protein LOC125012889 [Mugil cephalus]